MSSMYACAIKSRKVRSSYFNLQAESDRTEKRGDRSGSRCVCSKEGLARARELRCSPEERETDSHWPLASGRSSCARASGDSSDRCDRRRTSQLDTERRSRPCDRANIARAQRNPRHLARYRTLHPKQLYLRISGSEAYRGAARCRVPLETDR